MSSNKKPDFLSQLSKNALSALKKKLAKDKNESCPISTMNQLLQNPLPVPKLDNSLRSLRSKPRRPQPPPTLADSTVTGADFTNSMPVENDPEVRKEVELPNDTNQPLNVGNNESVFAVPTMRAPRTVKNGHSYLMDRNSKAATLAWMILDKKTIDKLFTLSIINILAVIEDCAPKTSENEFQNISNCEVLQILNEWLTNLADGIDEEAGDSDFPDMDNMTSVSNYPPFHQSYMGQFGNQTNLVAGIGQSVPTFMRPNAGSTVGSMYQHRNDTFMNQSFARPMVTGTGRMLPSFLNSTASVVGSMYDPHFNQTSFMHNKPLMGYPPHPLSMRSEVSMYRPLRDFHSNASTIMNPSTYPQNPQARLVGDNLSMSYNNSNMRRVPSDIGGNNRMNYAGEEDIMYGSNGPEQMEQSKRRMRRMLSPLQPVDEMQRINHEDFAIQQKSNQPDTTLKTSKTATITVQKLRNFNCVTSSVRCTPPLKENVSNDSKVTKVTRSGRAVRAPQTFRENVLNDSNVTRVTRSGRAVRAPQTFWASELSSITHHNQTIQIRGIKRKRCF